MNDPSGELAGALIPMLANQRTRVFSPARAILPKITGQTLGNELQPWMKWYQEKYGRAIDLPGSVYELVQIVRPAIVNGQEHYRVDDQTYTSHADLLARLRRDVQTTRDLGRTFELVIQVPQAGFPGDRLQPLFETMELLGEEISRGASRNGQEHGESSFGITVSPESDEFVPFPVALANLRRWSTPAPAGQ